MILRFARLATPEYQNAKWKANVKQKKFGQQKKKKKKLLFPARPLPPLTCYANRLSSCLLSQPIVQLPRRICFQIAALLKRGIQYIERDFACIWFPSLSGRLKAWPPCCLTHHSLTPPVPHPTALPRLPRCPLPRGPPLFCGLARVEQRQSGAREQTRVSLTASLHAGRAQTATVQPLHSPVCLCLVYTICIFSTGCTPGAARNNNPDCWVLHSDTLSTLQKKVQPFSPTE